MLPRVVDDFPLRVQLKRLEQLALRVFLVLQRVVDEVGQVAAVQFLRPLLVLGALQGLRLLQDRLADLVDLLDPALPHFLQALLDGFVDRVGLHFLLPDLLD